MTDENKTPPVECERPEFKVVTKQLLEEAIRKGEKNDGLTVIDFFVKLATSIGDNFATAVLAVHANVQDVSDVREYQLIIKVPIENELLRGLIIQGGMFRKECGAYTEVIPSLVNFQEDMGVEPIVPSVPRFYHGFENREEMTGVIIQDDLRPFGYKMADKRKGVDYQHSVLVVKELAKLHALSLALKKNDPERLRKRYDYVFEETHFHKSAEGMQRQMFPAMIKAGVEFVKSSSSDDVFKAQASKLLELDYLDTIRKAIQPSEPFAVVCHGDTWCNNLLFRYKEVDGAEVPVEVKLIDLQLVRYALPTTDLGYFLFTSTTRSMRRAHLKQLLQVYHSTFMETLAHVKVELPEFTLSVVEEMYKKTAAYGFIMSVIGLIPTLCNPDVLGLPDGNTPVEEQLDEFVSKLGQQDGDYLSLINERLVGSFEEAIEMGLLSNVD